MADEHIADAVADRVATITFDRPDALNALTPEMLVRLGDLLERAAADDAVGVVVLTGAGRAFSAGVDLKALAGREIVDGAVGDVLDVPARRAIALLANSPGSLAAYKDLYRVALDDGLAAGLAYEASTHYPIPDTAPRVADFR